MTRLARIMIVLGAVLYSVWIAAPSLGSHIPGTTSYVSELSAVGQPHAKLFRTSDFLAGALFLSAAILLWLSRRRNPIAKLGLLILGAATMADAWLPLSCTPTQDAMCKEAEANMTVPISHLAHTVSSSTASCGAVMCVLAIEWYRRGNKRTGWDRGRLFVAAAFMVGTVWTLLCIGEITSPALLGVAQRLCIIGLIAWLILWSISYRRPPYSAEHLASVRARRHQIS